MKVGTKVWHKIYSVPGVVKSANSVTLFVLWWNGVGTEVAIASVVAVTESGEHDG